MEGNATDAQIGALLVALKLNGEQTDELAGFVDVMREKAVRVSLDDDNAIDMCGTGGDGAGTFNISTAAALVVAGAGITVAKHGNRSISSRCGSADVLKALGINIEFSPDRVEACINEVGIGFLFAPLFHPAMKHSARARLDLGMKTCFNMLGPLTNPAGVRRQVVGAFSENAAEKIASVFQLFAPARVVVLHSSDGLDEVSLDGTTTLFEVSSANQPTRRILDASEFGLQRVARDAIRGGSAEQNAAIILDLLSGKRSPHRDIVIANAAMGLIVAELAASIAEGVAVATASIDSGKAMAKLDAMREFSLR